jgi:peptide subunit release factor 1 (eRF1)
MEQVKAIAVRGGRPTVSANTAQAPTFDGKTFWSTFRRQFETVAKHNMWSNREKSTFLITALKDRAADVLAGIPINTPYEDTLQTLEDRFGDQHFAAAYRCQLTTRRQKAGESLQEFATAIELLAHRAYPTLPEDHIGREAAKAFAHGIDDHDIKIQLLLGGEKSLNETLRQAIELQAVLVAARPQNSNTGPYRGNRTPPPRTAKVHGRTTMLELWTTGPLRK